MDPSLFYALEVRVPAVQCGIFNHVLWRVCACVCVTDRFRFHTEPEDLGGGLLLPQVWR